MRKKVFCFVLFILLFSFILTSQCFAVDSSVLPEEVYSGMFDTDKEYFESYSYYCLLFDDTNNVYALIYTESPMTITNNGTGLKFQTENGGRYNKLIYSSGSGVYRVDSTLDLSSNFSNTVKNISNYSFISANFDVINSSTGEVLYSLPKGNPEILAPIMENAGTEKTLSEVVGILPIILVVIISFLGIRKALKFISTLLRRS